MQALYILIVMALFVYLFYRIKSWRTKKPLLKQWVATKAQIALGLFILLFGVNRLFLPLSTFIIIVCAVFIILGSVYTAYAIKAYRFYLSKIVENNTQSQE